MVFLTSQIGQKIEYPKNNNPKKVQFVNIKL
jgi:hypothetical protein